MLVTSIFFFSHNVLSPSRYKIPFMTYIVLLPANTFNLDWSKILLFGKGSSIYQTITDFYQHLQWSLLKTLWKKERMLVTNILHFPQWLLHFIKEKILPLQPFPTGGLQTLPMDCAIICCLVELTHYHTMLHFDAL